MQACGELKGTCATRGAVNRSGGGGRKGSQQKNLERVCAAGNSCCSFTDFGTITMALRIPKGTLPQLFKEGYKVLLLLYLSMSLYCLEQMTDHDCLTVSTRRR